MTVSCWNGGPIHSLPRRCADLFGLVFCRDESVAPAGIGRVALVSSEHPMQRPGLCDDESAPVAHHLELPADNERRKTHQVVEVFEYARLDDRLDEARLVFEGQKEHALRGPTGCSEGGQGCYEQWDA